MVQVQMTLAINLCVFNVMCPGAVARLRFDDPPGFY